jgi:hypothetical protein
VSLVEAGMAVAAVSRMRTLGWSGCCARQLTSVCTPVDKRRQPYTLENMTFASSGREKKAVGGCPV